MKKLLYFILIISACVACHRRPIQYGYTPYAKVLFIFDWSNMPEAPEGLSVYCYPRTGGDPIIRMTNNIEQTSVSLIPGTYDILVFNRVTTGFGSLAFAGMDKFETAQVQTAETSKRWYTKAPVSHLTRTPEDFAASTQTDYVAKRTKIYEPDKYANININDIISDTLYFKPTLITHTTHITIQTKNMKELAGGNFARGVNTNFALGYNFATQFNTSTPCQHFVENWKSTFYPGSTGDGEIVATFNSFGFPKAETKTRVNSDDEPPVAPITDWRGILDLELALRGNIKYEDGNVYDTTLTIVQDPNKLDLMPVIYLIPENNDTIVLPEVDDTGGNGFDVTVEDWDNEIVDMPI